MPGEEEHQLEILLTKEQIQQRVAELGEKISVIMPGLRN